MIMIKSYRNREYVYIPLKQYVENNFKNAPKGWCEYIKNWVNEGMNIHNKDDYNKYLKKMNLKWFYFNKVIRFYKNLTKSKYAKIFDDDILRFFAHIYGLNFFNYIKYDLEINNPNLDKLLNEKFAFRQQHEKNQLEDDEMFSIMDLLPLKYGMNAIRRELLYALKVINGSFA